MDYVKPELLIVTAVLYFFGIALKQAEFIKDKYIPITLGATGIIICGIWVTSTAHFAGVTGCVDRSFRIRNAGHCCCRTEYLHPSDYQAGRKRRVGVEVVWH